MLKTTVKRGSFTNFGILSLLVVFVVLCLTALGALSLATSYADLRTARKYGDTASDYYKAESVSQQIIADLREGTDPEELSEKYSVAVEHGSENGTNTVSYMISIGKGPTKLSVTLGIRDGELTCLRHCTTGESKEADDGYYKLIS